MKYFVLVIILSIVSSILSFNEIKPRLCINCKHFITDDDTNLYGKCFLFPLKNDDSLFYISGIKNDEIIDYYHCSVARKYDSMCGKEGRKHKRKYTIFRRLKRKKL